jgi:hypothetical protein
MPIKRELTGNELEIVKTLIDSKAINFEAIGQVVAKHGADAAINLTGEDAFCGVMQRFVRAYRLRDPVAELAGLADLNQLNQDISR